jgi:hypothetical protein
MIIRLINQRKRNRMTPSKNPSPGKGYTIDSRIWKLINLNRKTDARGRIFTHESYYGKEISVYVSDTDQELEMCEYHYLLPYSLYTEIRKTKFKDEIGEPLQVQKNGNVYTTFKDKYVKIFVKEG